MLIILNLILHCVMNIVVPIEPKPKKLVKRDAVWLDTLVKKNINLEHKTIYVDCHSISSR